jgi:hypothetical protein
MAAVQGILGAIDLGAALLLLVFGISTIAQLLRRGGFELGLAHVVADTSARNVFLVGLCISLGALFGFGFIGSIEWLTGASLEVTSFTDSILFLVGAVGMLILMANAFRTSPLTIHEGWSLREVAERAALASTPNVPVVPGGLGVGVDGTREFDEPLGENPSRPR